jgi:sorbitol-6-phosphate 2-dehydrogenase
MSQPSRQSGELENKVAVVTGASRGLGRHLAERLGRGGCGLILCARRQDALAQAQDEVVAVTGARVLAQVADVTDERQVRALVATGVATFGRIDLQVCNAALSFSGGMHEIALDDWRRIVDVNLYRYFLCACDVSRAMIEGGGGAIVQINSRSGKRGRPKNLAYACAKGGGIVLTQSLSAELAPHKMRGVDQRRRVPWLYVRLATLAKRGSLQTMRNDIG